MADPSSFHTGDQTNGTGGYESVIFPWRGMKAQQALEMEIQSEEMQKEVSLLKRSLAARPSPDRTAIVAGFYTHHHRDTNTCIHLSEVNTTAIPDRQLRRRLLVCVFVGM